MTPALIAWDFDGVLNHNQIDGEFIWHKGFEEHLGLPLDPFREAIFRSGRFEEVLTGEIDLKDLITDWLQGYATDTTADDVLHYWFTYDDMPNDDVLAIVDAVPSRAVIATNNEPRRVQFIWETKGYNQHFEHIFASGQMGVLKPAPAFFEQIMGWSGVAPEEILLVDDSAKNIAAATALGWQGFHFTPGSAAKLRAHLGLDA